MDGIGYEVTLMMAMRLLSVCLTIHDSIYYYPTLRGTLRFEAINRYYNEGVRRMHEYPANMMLSSLSMWQHDDHVLSFSFIYSGGLFLFSFWKGKGPAR